MIKNCEICKEEFETLPNGGSRKYCFKCSPSYPKGGSKSKTISALRRAMKKQAVKELGGKCEICGYDKCIDALEFHHLDPSQKDFGISQKGYTRSWENVKKELDKCIMVCSNCHKEIHSKEHKEYKDLLMNK